MTYLMKQDSMYLDVNDWEEYLNYKVHGSIIRLDVYRRIEVVMQGNHKILALIVEGIRICRLLEKAAADCVKNEF
ncbi:MAG: hypothetical protein JWM56_833 [Candidatus Peribacteria bacterium]|nr:hypothetical protein [Candidatus Peribacteria bacterium]